MAKSAPNRLGPEIREKRRHTLIRVSIDCDQAAPLPSTLHDIQPLWSPILVLRLLLELGSRPRFVRSEIDTENTPSQDRIAIVPWCKGACAMVRAAGRCLRQELKAV